MADKTFQIATYDIAMSRDIALGGSYHFDAVIECKGSGGDRLAIYFAPPGASVPANIYNPAAKWATIYVPAALYGWYRDLLLNEKPIYAHCFGDHPEWNNIATGEEFTGETEAMPDVAAWLAAHPAIANAILWESASGVQAYPAWSAAMRADLANAFKQAWNFSSVMTTDPVPNKKVLADADSVVQIIDQSYAWPMFLAYVAQSLAVEIGSRVGWSLTGYSATGLAQLFDSRETFHWNAGAGGYEITFSHGVAVPCAPNQGYSLLYAGMIGSNRSSTIAGLLDWCRSHLRHFMGGWDTANVYDQWQYRGFPPVIRMIQGTSTLSEPSWGIQHITGGCWGTTGFLRAILRTVNIPARLVTHCGHAQPNFVEDGLYLSHGDDPYNALTTSVPPMPISQILVSQAQFDAWFGAGVSATDQCNNVGRRTVDLSLTWLPTYLLKAYCSDMAAGKTHANGSVYDIYKKLYTVAQLEAQNLWGKMDAKIASLGGCAHL
jgi:hypothetical protein